MPNQPDNELIETQDTNIILIVKKLQDTRISEETMHNSRNYET